MNEDSEPAGPWRGGKEDGRRVRGVSAELVDRAWQLRREPTAAENVLWESLRGRRLNGWKFRFQHAVGTYVFDFYCPALRLVVEVDGSVHDTPDAAERDRVRRAWLEQVGYGVVVVMNGDVFGRLPEVLARIEAVGQERESKADTVSEE